MGGTVRPAFQCTDVMDVICHSKENLHHWLSFYNKFWGTNKHSGCIASRWRLPSFQLCNILGWDWHSEKDNVAKSVLFHSRTQQWPALAGDTIQQHLLYIYSGHVCSAISQKTPRVKKTTIIVLIHWRGYKQENMCFLTKGLKVRVLVLI